MARRNGADQIQRLDTADRRSFVIRLRRAGASYHEIARAAVRQFGEARLPKGWDARYAYKDIQRELAQVHAEMKEERDNVLILELERLDNLTKILTPQLSKEWVDSDGNIHTTVDYKAVDRFLSVMQRRAKYLGLDSPDLHAMTDEQGNALETNVISIYKMRDGDDG